MVACPGGLGCQRHHPRQLHRKAGLSMLQKHVVLWWF